jgi:hypothetical protein
MNAKTRFKSYTDFVEEFALNNPDFVVTKWTGNYHYLGSRETMYYVVYKQQ